LLCIFGVLNDEKQLSELIGLSDEMSAARQYAPGGTERTTHTTRSG